jgi:iron complex outermembrane receptor protein
MAQETCDHIMTGEIVDASGIPLNGATIQIIGSEYGTISDKDGIFSLKGICIGTYTLEIKYIGYKTQFLEVIVPVYGHLSIILEEDAMLLRNITVEESIEADVTRSSSSLSQREIDAIGGKSLAESLKSITGVTSLQTGPTISKPVIHGLHSNRVLILNNGIRQEGQQWGSEHAPEIDPFIASDITVVKGADAVRYGSDAIAGLIIVDPPKLHRNIELGGDLNLGYMSNGRGSFASGLIEGGLNQIPGLAWRLQGTGKYFGDSHAPDYILSNTGLREADFSAALGFFESNFGTELYFSRFNTSLGILSASHIGNLTDLNDALNSDTPTIIEPFTYNIIPPSQEIIHNLIKFNIYKEGDLGKLELQYGGQINDRQEYDIRRTSADDRPSMALKLYSHEIDLTWEKKSETGFQTIAGINASIQENDNQPGTGVKPLIPDYNSWSMGMFGIEKYVHNNWLLEAGLRFDYNFLQVLTFDAGELVKPEYNFKNFAATLGFDYQFNDQFRYSTNMSSAFRPPHVSEMFSQGLHHGTASIEEGLFVENGQLIPGYDLNNPDSETAIKWIHSFIYSNSNWEVELSPYFSRINNFIFLEPQQELRLTIRGAFPVYKYKQTEARFTGLDAAIVYHFSENIETKFKSSIVRGRNLDLDDWLIFMPSDRYELSISYEKEDFIGLQDFHLSLGGLQVLEQTRVPPETEIKDPPPSYFLINFHTGFGFQIGREKFNLYLNLDNLLNTSYRDYLNRFRFYADDVGRNLTLRLKYDFHSHK